MSTLPRIALVAAGPDIIGGQGVQAMQLVSALRGDGYPVRFLPINPRFPFGMRWLRRVPYLRTLVNEAIYVPGLLRVASADVVHVFSASYASFLLAPAPAMLIGRLLNKRVVLHYHSGEAHDHLSKWGRLVHPWLRLADDIVVPSRYLQAVFAQFGYQTRVVPNVVDTTSFRYRERHPREPRLICSRNLETIYRVDVIIQAFALILARCPQATLTVAGYGGEEARLKQLAASLGCRERIRFVGKMAPDAMPALYADADIFMNASEVDNQPVSILEAFASGLPVVSTPTGDIAAMVRHGETGLLVPHGNPGAVAEAVLALIGQPERARAIAQRARTEVEHFTWPAVRAAWADLYEVAQPFGAAKVPVSQG